MICESCKKAADESKMIYHQSCPDFRSVSNVGSNKCYCQHRKPQEDTSEKAYTKETT